MLAGCIGLTAVVPTPLAALHTLIGGHSEPAGPQMLDTAALTVAGAIVWGLIGWTTLIAVIAVLTRAPGTVGRTARQLLGRVAPGFVRRAVIAGMGVSMLTGVTACSHDDGTAVPGLERPAVVLVAADLTIGAGADPAGGVGASIGIGIDIGREPGHEWTGTAMRGVPSPAAMIRPGRALSGAAGDRVADEVDLDWPVERPTGTAPRVDVDWPEITTSVDPTPAAPRPAHTTATLPGPHTRADGPSSTVVVVRKGDTLWHIAATQLGPEASNEQIDATWRLWYAANREVIGSDPDQIEPGQRLRTPDPVVLAAAGGTAAQSPPAGTEHSDTAHSDTAHSDTAGTDTAHLDTFTGDHSAGANPQEH